MSERACASLHRGGADHTQAHRLACGRLLLQQPPQLAQHCVALHRLVPGQGAGPGAFEFDHNRDDVHHAW